MRKILYLSLVDWSWIKQRPHHFCLELSKQNKVVFFYRRSLFKNTIKTCKNMQSCNFFDAGKSDFLINKNLIVSQKPLIPRQHKYNLIEKINNKILMRRIIKLDIRYAFDWVIITNPSDLKFLKHDFLSNKKILYDCMDNFEEFPQFNYSEKSLILHYEKMLIKLVDKISVSSENLKTKLQSYSSSPLMIKVINNGVDLNHFNDNFQFEKINVQGLYSNRKKICYIGTVAEWFDYDLIRKAALKFKSLDFLIIGPYSEKLTESHRNLNNVIYTGVQHYNDIPNILKQVDYTMMPFVLNSLVESVNPVKIYEYLAMGKPVIATRYSETEKFQDLIMLYDSHDEFLVQLEDLINGNVNFDCEKLKHYAAKNSWVERVRQINEFLN